jgi:hypothetical protein
MALDDEIAEMQAVNKRLKAENILLRAVSEAFDLIFGPADPLTEIDQADSEDKDGGLAREAAETASRADLPASRSPHD